MSSKESDTRSASKNCSWYYHIFVFQISWSLPDAPEVTLNEVRLTAFWERQEPFDKVFVELCPFQSEQGREGGFCKIGVGRDSHRQGPQAFSSL